MATALKDIPFTAPVMAGATSGGGTAYYLDTADTITGCGGSIIQYMGCEGWKFLGTAARADTADSADTAREIGGSGGTLSYDDISASLGRIVLSCTSYYFNGGLMDDNNSLSFSDIYNNIGRIENNNGAYYFNGGLTDGCSSLLSFGAISSKLSPISSGSSGTSFDGALTCNGYTLLDYNGGTVMSIGGSTYMLSVDSNGFVKATLY